MRARGRIGAGHRAQAARTSTLPRPCRARARAGGAQRAAPEGYRHRARDAGAACLYRRHHARMGARSRRLRPCRDGAGAGRRDSRRPARRAAPPPPVAKTRPPRIRARHARDARDRHHMMGDDMAERVGVIGAGTMGNGIAQACAVAGIDVVMVDVADAAVERGLAAIGGSLERLRKKDKISDDVRTSALARVRGSTDYAELAGTGLIIEAATENLELKLRILKAIDAPDAVLASNTSSISITALAAVVRRPERFVGMHFFN